MNSFRMICSTFIDWFAQSMRFFPMSARSRFFTSQLICVGVVDIPLLIHEYVNNPGISAPPDLQNTRNGRPYLRIQAYGSVTRGRRQTSSVLPGTLPLRRLQSRLAQACFTGKLGCFVGR